MDFTTFQCSCCGETLEGPALAWFFDAPDAWYALTEEDRSVKGALSSDQCIIDEDYFILGLVEIPIEDADEPFAWGVWVSLSKFNYERSCELWDDERRVDEPAYFGWLCSSIPGYPDTLNLKTAVYSRNVGLRPVIELEPTNHPLALEQRAGITMTRVREIAEQMHHISA